MKSKRILIELSGKIYVGDSYAYQLPRIEAYAIEYFDFLINGVGGGHPCIEIQGPVIEITATNHYISDTDNLELLIYYHGIRDYEALFSFVADASLRQRLAQFYEDAEKCFDSGAWLPFSLMCGGMFEGVLISQNINDHTFAQKISNALNNNIIDPPTQLIMDKVRANRNLVHANKHTEDYMTRKEAMDIRSTLDKLIEKF